MNKRIIIIFITVILFSDYICGQDIYWKDTLFTKEWFSYQFKVIERYKYENNELTEKHVYESSKFSIDDLTRADYFFYSKNNSRGYGFYWSINIDTFLLAKYYRFRSDIPCIDTSYILYQNDGGIENIESVRQFTGYINGKEVKREYPPGEFYLDYPVNPDTLPTYFIKLCGILERKEE